MQDFVHQQYVSVFSWESEGKKSPRLGYGIFCPTQMRSFSMDMLETPRNREKHKGDHIGVFLFQSQGICEIKHCSKDKSCEINTTLVEEISATEFWCHFMPCPHLLVLRCGSPIIGEALSRESIKNSVAGPNKPKDLFEIPLSPNDFWELCPFSKAPMVEVKVSAVTPIRTWLAHLVAHVSPSSRTLVS